MDTLGFVLTLVCGLIVLVSSAGKLSGQAQVVEILDHVGVSGPLRQALPFLQIAGGVGCLISLVVFPVLGVIALVCLALYFLGAVGFHVRVGDGASGFGVPLGLAVLMIVAAIVRATTI